MMHNGYEIAEFAEMRQVDVVVQRVIVNNEERNVTGKAWAICCPHCGRAIYQFPPNVSAADAYKARAEGADDLLNIARYCPACGTKLKYQAGPTVDCDDADCAANPEKSEK